MNASAESLLEQWPSWFQMCLRYPSVVLYHPWNETEGLSLVMAFGVLEEICNELPPVVMAHRDVCHIHKYWRSLFENVGCYYDHADQFPQPIMVDEFGGNYVDGEGIPGGYMTLSESFARFLGEHHDAHDRLQLNEEANARIAEYWRRLDAAGFSPFCLLGSWEDCNHHFMGPLRDGCPKPVWDALTAAYAPVSLSLDVWDRNYLVGQQLSLPLHLFNGQNKACCLNVACRIRRGHGHQSDIVREHTLEFSFDAFSHTIETVFFQLPDEVGERRIEAELLDAPLVQRPVRSSWRIRTSSPCIEQLPRIALIGDEPELAAFLQMYAWVPSSIDEAEVVLLGRSFWAVREDNAVLSELRTAKLRGARVVFLDIGPMDLGQGYPEDGDLGP